MEEPEYDEKIIKLFEHVWGDGFLSPGGSEEVDLIVKGADLTDKTLLDLGCGTGGITLHLAQHYPLKSIVGFDVEDPGHQKAKQRLAKINVEKNVEFVLGEAGSLPFEDSAFDVVFTKDALIHVSDLGAIFSEIHRVLKPDGVFLGCDWMSSQAENYSTEMLTYLESEGLEFAPNTMDQYKASLEAAGFTGIAMSNRNHWHRQQVRREIVHIGKTHHKALVDEFGGEFIGEQLVAWESLAVVADRGEIFPVHFCCEKNG